MRIHGRHCTGGTENRRICTRYEPGHHSRGERGALQSLVVAAGQIDNLVVPHGQCVVVRGIGDSQWLGAGECAVREGGGVNLTLVGCVLQHAAMEGERGGREREEERDRQKTERWREQCLKIGKAYLYSISNKSNNAVLENKH